MQVSIDTAVLCCEVRKVEAIANPGAEQAPGQNSMLTIDVDSSLVHRGRACIVIWQGIHICACHRCRQGIPVVAIAEPVSLCPASVCEERLHRHYRKHLVCGSVCISGWMTGSMGVVACAPIPFPSPLLLDGI